MFKPKTNEICAFGKIMVVCLKTEFQPSKHLKQRNEICLSRLKMCWEVGKRAEAGRKDGMSCSRELDSRYDYLGASRTLMCDA